MTCNFTNLMLKLLCCKLRKNNINIPFTNKGVKAVPIIESAKKRVKTNEKKKEVNRYWKNKLKDTIKEYETAVEEGNIKKAEELLPETYKIIDKAASHNIIHKNNANRKKSKMKRMLNKIK